MKRRSMTTFVSKVRYSNFSHPYRWATAFILLIILATGFSKTLKLQGKPCSGQSGTIHSNGGGFIANSVTIIHGNPYIDETSEVCESASLWGDVKITNGSRIRGRAHIADIVTVSNSVIEGDAIIDSREGEGGITISNQSRIYGNAKIIEDSVINHSNLYGQAQVRGQSNITSSQIYGQARILEKSVISSATIHGKAQISGSAIVRSTSSLTEVCDDVIVGGTTIVENTTKLCKSIPNSPVLSIIPKINTFTNTPVGGVSEEVFFTIKNDGAIDASGCSSLQFSGDVSEFQITQNTCNSGIMVAEGGSCLVKLHAKPTTTGNKSLTIARTCAVGGIASTDANGIKYSAVDSTQMALTPLHAELSTTALGTVNSTSQKFVFQNTGTQPIINCGPVTLLGNDADQFTITKNSCGTNSLPPLSGSNTFFDFSNSALFTVSDSSKIEITNGVARLKKASLTADSNFYASYNNTINGDLGNGNLTATPTGGANINNGTLNLNADDVRYVDYDALGKSDFQKIATLRFRLIPNYQGTPATSQTIFSAFENSSSNLNRLQLVHSNSGALTFLAWDNAGNATISYNFGNYNAIIGEEAEVELDIDFAHGETRLYVNGEQSGSTLTTQLSRIGDNISKMRLGSNPSGTSTSNFSIGQLAIFNTIQHTSNYSIADEWLSYPTDHPYIEMASSVPFTSALKNFEAITTGGTADQVRFLISIDNGASWKYWSGFSWANSNLSFSQATPSSLINSKISLLGTTGSFKFRALLHSATGATTPHLDEVTFGNLLGTCEVRLSSAPTSAGQKYTTLSRTCQNVGEVKSASNGITYSSVAPVLNVTPFNYQYGSYSIGMPAGTKTFTFRNDTNAKVQYCSAPTILGANPEDFQITSDSCGTTSLNPGASCTVNVSASPQDIGTRSATLVRNCSHGGLASTEVNGLTVFGQDLNPVLAVNPEVASFGDIFMGTTSASTVVTFNNTGGSAATSCQAPTLTGAHAAEFIIVSDSCDGMDLPAGIGQCSVVVKAKPTGLDLRTANLDLTCASVGTISSVLEVNSVVPGPTPNLLLSPLAFDFGQVPNGDVSASHIFTIDNLGSGAATQCSKPYLTGADYQQFQIVNDQCAQNDLLSGASCSIEIAASPNHVGALRSTLNRTCIIGGTVRTLTNAITAQSLLVEPVLAIAPTPYNFGTLAVGGSASNTFTISNSGLGNATLCSAPVIEGNTTEFSITSDSCGTNNLPASGSCAIQVGFNPLSSGTKTLTLKRSCTNGGNVVANISGQAVAPLLSMEPTAFNFGNIIVGQSSNVQTFTVKNNGNGDALGCGLPTITGVDSAHFSLNSITCPGGVVPANGGTCTIDVTFAPFYRLPKNAQLGFTCSTGGTLTAALSGAGVSPILEIAPTSHNFGSFSIGQTSPPQAFTITNTGEVTASGCSAPVITGADSANFSLNVLSCPAGTIGSGGGTCNLEVSFTPLTSNSKNVRIERVCTFGGTVSASLSGVGLAPSLAIDPTSHDFGSIALGQTSTPQTFTVTNSGAGNASGCGAPTIAGTDNVNFSVSSTTCSSGSITAGGSCDINVNFTPTTRSAKNASLQLTCSNGGTMTASLTGTGVGPQLAFTPTSHDFGNINVGETSAPQTFTVNNTGDGNASGCGAPTIAGTDNVNFSVSSTTCSSGSITAGGSCDVNISFTPTTRAAKNASVQLICSNGGTITATVAGTGVAPQLAITPASHDFGNTVLGQTSAAQIFTLTNNGDGSASGCTTPVLTGADSNQFSLNNVSCSSTSLNPGGNCQIEVKFSPLSIATKNSNLQIACATGGTVTASLAGTGVGPMLSTNPSPINFGTIENGVTTTPLNITFTNSGTGAASGCGPFTLDGGNASEFQIVSGSETCGTTLLLTGSCALDLKAIPTTVGVKATTLKKVCSVGGTLTASVNATSAQAILSIQPLSYNYGDVFLNSRTDYKDFTFYNSGLVAASGCGALTLSGLNGDEFDVLDKNVCGTSIAPGGSCTAKVRAHATALGLFNGAVNLHCSSGTVTSSLIGTGISITAQMAIVPAVNDYGELSVSTSSRNKTFTIANTTEGRATGCQGAVLEGPDATQFTIESGTCTGTMAMKGICQVTVSAIPTTLGIKTATLKRVCNIGGTARASLSVTAVPGNPAIVFTQSSQDFGNIPVNQQTADALVTLSNITDGRARNCAAPALSGPNANQFIIHSDGCGTNSLNPRSTCQIAIAATPNSIGLKQATLTRSCVLGGTASMSLSANVTASPLAILANKKSIDFGQVTNNGSSKLEPVTFINQAKSSLINCSTPKITGANANQFAIADNTCMNSEIPSSSGCRVKIYASPNSIGNKTASLKFACGSGSAFNIPLTATSAAGLAQIKPDAVIYDFASALTAQASKSKLITWTNNGPGPATGCNAVAITGTNASDFKIESSNCSTSLNGASDTCSTYVTATPTSTGKKSANVIFSCAVGGSATASLKAVAAEGKTSLAMSENDFDFGFTGINQASKIHTFVLVNKGAGNASSCSAPSLTGVQASEFKILEDTCGSQNLLAQKSCQIKVIANPKAPGLKKAQLTRQCAIGGIAAANLNVAGKIAAPTLKFDRPQIEFATVPLGQAAEAQEITLTNTGTGPALGCSNPVFTGANASEFEMDDEDSTCNTATMNPGESCTIYLDVVPTSLGVRTGSLSRTCSTGGTVSTLMTVTATSPRSAITASPTTFNFLTVPSTQASTVAQFVISNTSKADVRNCTTTLAGPNANEFRITPTNNLPCIDELAAGNACTISLEFAPVSPGNKTAILKQNCGIGGNVWMNVEGTATAASSGLALTPTGVNFTNVPVGTQSRDKLITLINASSGRLRACSNPSLSGPNAGEFNLNYTGLAKPCLGAATISKGDFCQVIVASAPTGTVGDKNANLNFACTVGGTISAPLYARGVLPGPPQLFVKPSLLAFDPFQKKQLSLVIKNNGEEDAKDCQAPELLGASRNAFKLVANTCTESILASGESCKVTIEPNGPIATIGSHSVLVRRRCQIGGEILAIARTNSSRTGAGADYLPIKTLENKDNKHDCILFDDGQVQCLDVVKKANLIQLKTQSSSYFAKDFYRKEKKSCVKTIKNQEMCWENL